MAVPDAELLWGWAGFPLMLDLDPVCIFNQQKKTSRLTSSRDITHNRDKLLLLFTPFNYTMLVERRDMKKTGQGPHLLFTNKSENQIFVFLKFRLTPMTFPPPPLPPFHFISAECSTN